MQKETETILPTKETTPTFENTPTRRTKASAARRLSIENPKPTETPLTTASSNVNPTPTATIQELTNETNQQPPSTNVDTTPQTEKKQIYKTQTTYHQLIFTSDIPPASIHDNQQMNTKQSPKDTRKKLSRRDEKREKETKLNLRGQQQEDLRKNNN
ncbi:hypothetical protein Tco_1420032 [Tanacetum coccineum]